MAVNYLGFQNGTNLPILEFHVALIPSLGQNLLYIESPNNSAPDRNINLNNGLFNSLHAG